MASVDGPGAATAGTGTGSPGRRVDVIGVIGVIGVRGSVPIVTVLSLAAGLIGAAADAHPTAYPLLDAVFRFAFAALVTAAAARSTRGPLLLLAGLTAAASHDLRSGPTAFVALGIVVVAVVLDRNEPWLGALVGALASVSLLRLPDLGPHGTTAVVACLTVVPVLASAYRSRGHLAKRRTRRVLLVAGVGIGVAIAGFLVALAWGASRIGDGTTSAQAGVRFAKEGDGEASASSLHASVTAFSDAERAFGSPLTWPARLVPGLSHQVVALDELSAVGADLATAASDAERRATYRSIPVNDGRIDIDLIRSFGPPLADLDVALEKAGGRLDRLETSRLAPPLVDNVNRLRAEVRNAAEDTSTAQQAVAVAPDLLGANGPRRYFVAFTTPAESRGVGGFLGSWAELTVDGGKLELTRSGRGVDLGATPGAPPRELAAPTDYLTRYGPLDVENEVRDVTFSPDFPSVAQALESIYPQTPGGQRIDGVILLDPYAIAAMLKITGPIKVEGYDTEVNASNAADILLRRQYLDFADDKAGRVDFLDEVSRKTFNRFIRSRSLRPAQLANVLGPLVEQRRLLAWSAQSDEQRLIERVHLDGAFPYHPPPTAVIPPDASADVATHRQARPNGQGDTDFFGLATNNAGNNKIDIYLRREVDYAVSFDPTTGAVEATATVTLHNDAPPSGLPEYVIKNRKDSGQPLGTNWLWFNFYSPHSLTSASKNGEALPVGAGYEFGLHVYDVFLAVPPGGTTTVVLQLQGSIRADTTYRLSSYAQPVVNPDHVTVEVRHPAPWHGPALEPGQPSEVVIPDGQRATVNIAVASE